jgi:hypothetical protein
VLAGSILSAAIRVWVYEATGRQPNIRPGVGYIFFPFLAVPLTLLALLFHTLLRKFFAYTKSWQWLLAGLAYGLWFLAFLGPQMLVVMVIANPFVFRWVQIAKIRPARDALSK